MARRIHEIAPGQMALDFSAKVETFLEVKGNLFESLHDRPTAPALENEFECCIEIVAAIKKALRESNMNREQLVDAINAYFGRTNEGAAADPPICRKPLTLHQMNHYLSKPAEYPIPAYYLFAIHQVTGVIEPGATIVAAAGGQVATAEEIKLLQLGKLEATLDEMRRLRSELRGKARR